MDKKPLPRKWIIIVIACAIVVFGSLIALFVVRGEQIASSAATTTSSTDGASTTVAIDSSSTASSAMAGVIAAPSAPFVPPTAITPQGAPVPVIAIVTPSTGTTWQIGQSNLISWNNQANITGEIDLLDSTGQLVGVITSNTGPQQTSYSWDTREVYLGRYSPVKKDVVPGTYLVRLKFDGNNLPDIATGAITITN